MDLPITRAHLDGLVVFMAVAELRGFRAAARRLGITPSAVSQTIRNLEVRVGVALLSRTTRSVALTEAGQRLLDHARPAIDMLSSGLNAAAGLAGDVSGLLRINMPRAALPLVANRLLPGFLERYPHVRLELFGEDRLVDIVDAGFDAGIRLGDRVQPDMVALPLTPALRFAVVGTAAFLRRHGRPLHPQELAGMPCIRFRSPSGGLDDWQFNVEGQRVKVAVEGPLIVNEPDMNARAALRGVGLAQLPLTLALHHLRQRTLESVLDDYAIEAPGLMLYYPSRTQSLPKLRAFVAFARERMLSSFTPDDFLPLPFDPEA